MEILYFFEFEFNAFWIASYIVEWPFLVARLIRSSLNVASWIKTLEFSASRQNSLDGLYDVKYIYTLDLHCTLFLFKIKYY